MSDDQSADNKHNVSSDGKEGVYRRCKYLLCLCGLQAMEPTMPREKGDEAFRDDYIELPSDLDAADDPSVEALQERGPDSGGNESGIPPAEESDDDDLAMGDILIKYNGSDAEMEQGGPEEW